MRAELALTVPLTHICLCVQLYCVLQAKSTRSVPQRVACTAASQQTVGSWGVAWLVVTAPQGYCGTLRASVCPPACAPASLEPTAMHLEVSPRRTATTGECDGC